MHITSESYFSHPYLHIGDTSLANESFEFLCTNMRSERIVERQGHVRLGWLRLSLTLLLSSSPRATKGFLSTTLQVKPVSGVFRSSPVFLYASVEADDQDTKNMEKLSRPQRKALERQKKEDQLRSKKKSPAYTLHSKNIFELTKESTAEDVIRAIKRAQNNHDHQDLKVIADFLINDCDVGFAYGYRGSLLARLAVAALHFGNNQVARRAIDIRRLEYRPSMLPMESAAIIRGLLRVHNATDALEILFDELSSPLEVSSHRIHQHIVLAVNTDFCLTPFTRGSI